MSKELPIVSTLPPEEEPQSEPAVYSRVFCLREDSPPLRLLLDFLKSKNHVPLVPKMDPAALDDWDWVQISLGYHRERKPIQLFCIRDRGSYKDVFEAEQTSFLNRLAVYDDEEGQIARDFVRRARFIATTRMLKNDMTEEGYDFNGWILEFFQENCNGIVQIDEHGFFSPRGELVVDMEETAESEEEPILNPESQTQHG